MPNTVSTNYDEDILDRIQGIYDSSSEDEKGYLIQILQELSEYGRSETYEKIWLSDYKEIPVSIDTFLESDTYLGKATNNGKAVYPYWREHLRNFFGSGNKYSQWILTGATRIGKTSTGITAAIYLLYRLMCLRNPQQFFKLKEVSKLTFRFFNLNLQLAQGVAYREFNDTIRTSPWFVSHGTFSRSQRNFYYIPEGGTINIDYGSDASHGLGQQIYCVVGDTQIVTDNGIFNISEKCEESINILQYDYDSNSLVFVPSKIIETKKVYRTIRITLENGVSIEGTPDHPIMLTNGSYKQLQHIQNSDDVLVLR